MRYFDSVNSSSTGIIVLGMNTLAFTVCFASWVINGVLVTFLVKNGIYPWDQMQIGWLVAIPVLTGSLARLPLGVLTDHFGGRTVFTSLMLVSAVAMFFASLVDSYAGFILAGCLFGISGASFAVGIAYTSVWFRREKQGTALGIFGAGNIGAALTSIGAPSLLAYFTNNGSTLEGWRNLPRLYATGLLLMAVIFFIFTHSKKIEQSQAKSITQRLAPLRNPRVWRFSLYYFCLFGGFVGLAQWLIPYYVNYYQVSLQTAGWLAAVLSLSAGLIRPLGGLISDKWGARRVMYAIFAASLTLTLFLTIPSLNVVWFTLLIFLLGLILGIGMAAVYKHIPGYFPNEVGVVGGLVSVIGGLGGFFLPLIFGFLLRTTGLWISCWIFFALVIAVNLAWMHQVVRGINQETSEGLHV